MTMQKTLLSALLALVVAAPLSAQTAPTGPEYPLSGAPTDAEAAAFAKAGKDIFLADLATIQKLFSGDKAEGAEISLGGVAFLEAFTAVYLTAPTAESTAVAKSTDAAQSASTQTAQAPAPQPRSSNAEAEFRREVYRFAKDAITGTYTDATEARKRVMQITRYRNKFLGSTSSLAIVAKYKAILADEIGGEGFEMPKLKVTPALSSQIAALKLPEGAAKDAFTKFFKTQSAAAKAEFDAIEGASAKKAPEKAPAKKP
jgi:hypothetical protein